MTSTHFLIFSRIKGLLEKSNAKKAIGGAEFDREDKYIEPTVLSDVQADDATMADEVRIVLMQIRINGMRTHWN